MKIKEELLKQIKLLDKQAASMFLLLMQAPPNSAYKEILENQLEEITNEIDKLREEYNNEN